MLWLIRGFVIGVAAGVGYWRGRAQGAQAVADALMNDPVTGRAALEKLAGRWGAKLEMFEMPKG